MSSSKNEGKKKSARPLGEQKEHFRKESGAAITRIFPVEEQYHGQVNSNRTTLDSLLILKFHALSCKRRYPVTAFHHDAQKETVRRNIF
jgi:hypothetical protein